jgi:tRNA (guanine-N7-)-methyltransferase
VRGPVRLPLEQLEPYLFHQPDPPSPIAWRVVFGNDHAVEVEVGFGKGLFLLSSSQARPGVNFFGIEIERKYQLFTANRIAKRRIANVRLACADARMLLRDCVPAGSVDVVHVYFPDPWWKKRHHKRRLFTADFAAACHRVLRTRGRLEVMSDVENYFKLMTTSLADLTRWSRLPDQPRADEYRTNFERKYRAAGKPIFGASYVAVGPTVVLGSAATT